MEEKDRSFFGVTLWVNGFVFLYVLLFGNLNHENSNETLIRNLFPDPDGFITLILYLYVFLLIYILAFSFVFRLFWNRVFAEKISGVKKINAADAYVATALLSIFVEFAV